MSKDMFEIDIDDINIEDIMTEIRKNIKEKGIIDEEIQFDQVSSDENVLPEYLRIINIIHNVVAYKEITSHRKFIGNFIVFIKKTIRKCMSWYIDPIVEQQNKVNAFSTRILNSMSVKLNYMEEKIKKLEENVIQLEKRTDKEMKYLEQKNEDVKQILTENMKCRENEFDNKFNNIYEGTQYNNVRLKRIERKLKYGDISIEKTKCLIPEIEKLDFDYFLFEEKYRGNQQYIKNRLAEHLRYFEKQNNVLDIGCGRGEFLEILREHNIEAKGIDIDEDMLLLCKEKNLDVLNIDALTYLINLEDNSLGGIILTQVIEHMEPNYLIQLISLAYEKLKPNAYFVAETINPQSLIVFTEAYFMDLSHIRMIHPYTIKFLVESEGFKEISIKYLSKVGDDLRIPEVSEFPIEFNKAINKLNDVVYGYRDYAIIGRK